MSEANEQEAKQENPLHAESHERCYCMGAGPAFSKFASLFEPPGDAGEHFRRARIEILRGIRELIDHRIDTLSRANAKGTRVTVE
jgi:hypothetical protein